MKKNAFWLVVSVFSLFLMTGCVCMLPVNCFNPCQTHRHHDDCCCGKHEEQKPVPPSRIPGRGDKPAMPPDEYQTDKPCGNLMPVIAKQPEDRFVEIGSNTFFILEAVPSGLNYQWYFANNPMPGETNHILHIMDVQTNKLGEYYCLVSTPCDDVKSEVRTLSAYAISGAGTMTLWSTPPTTSPGGGTICPYNSIGRLRFPQAYGSSAARLSPGASASGPYPPYTAWDGSSRMNTMVFYQGTIGSDTDCDVKEVIVSGSSPRYVFYIYFPAPLPPAGAAYPLRLNGFGN